MFRSPTQAGLPSLAILLADLPADHGAIARHLGITLSTLQKYLRAGQAPRPIMLALFWESRWGRSAADVEAANWGAVHYRLAAGMERQNAALLRTIRILEGELAQSGAGAANGPVFRSG